MRERADAKRIRAFLRELGRRAAVEGRVYLTGGATAVLEGWRSSTIEVDLRFEPDQDALLRALPELKELLDLNVELASPPDFIPELPGWRDRSLFVVREGRLDVHHFDRRGRVQGEGASSLWRGLSARGEIAIRRAGDRRSRLSSLIRESAIDHARVA